MVQTSDTWCALSSDTLCTLLHSEEDLRENNNTMSYLDVHTCTFMYLWISIYISIKYILRIMIHDILMCTCTYTFRFQRVCIIAYIHVYIQTCVYIHKYIYMYIYIYKYNMQVQSSEDMDNTESYTGTCPFTLNNSIPVVPLCWQFIGIVYPRVFFPSPHC